MPHRSMRLTSRLIPHKTLMLPSFKTLILINNSYHHLSYLQVKIISMIITCSI